MNHTPGPWILWYYSEGDFTGRIMDKEMDKIVADRVAPQNALLIASAPDLFEVLLVLRDAIKTQDVKQYLQEHGITTESIDALVTRMCEDRRNIPLGHNGISSDGEGNNNSTKTEHVARPIVAPLEILNTQGVAQKVAIRITNSTESPYAKFVREQAQLLLAELGHGTHKGEQGQEEIER